MNEHRKDFFSQNSLAGDKDLNTGQETEMNERRRLEKTLIELDDCRANFFLLKRDQRILTQKIERVSHRILSEVGRIGGGEKKSELNSVEKVFDKISTLVGQILIAVGEIGEEKGELRSGELGSDVSAEEEPIFNLGKLFGSLCKNCQKKVELGSWGGHGKGDTKEGEDILISGSFVESKVLTNCRGPTESRPRGSQIHIKSINSIEELPDAAPLSFFDPSSTGLFDPLPSRKHNPALQTPQFSSKIAEPELRSNRPDPNPPRIISKNPEITTHHRRSASLLGSGPEIDRLLSFVDASEPRRASLGPGSMPRPSAAPSESAAASPLRVGDLPSFGDLAEHPELEGGHPEPRLNSFRATLSNRSNSEVSLSVKRKPIPPITDHTVPSDPMQKLQPRSLKPSMNSKSSTLLSRDNSRAEEPPSSRKIGHWEFLPSRRPTLKEKTDRRPEAPPPTSERPAPLRKLAVRPEPTKFAGLRAFIAAEKRLGPKEPSYDLSRQNRSAKENVGDAILNIRTEESHFSTIKDFSFLKKLAPKVFPMMPSTSFSSTKNQRWC